MKKNKVCHITSAHPDGDVRIFHKECVSLAEEGYDVSLVIPNTESRIDKGVNIVSFIYEPSSRLSRFTKSVNLAYKKAIAVNADIYHLHDPELLRIALKLKKKGKKVIFDAHEDLPRQILSKKYINKYLRKYVSKAIEKYEKRVTSKLDAVVTATPFIRDKFLLYNKNSIDINNFPLSREILVDEKQETNHKENNICYIGGITEIRGIKELVNALEYAPKIRLKLAGEFSPKSFKDTVSKVKGWNQVDELGFIGRNESLALKNNSIAGLVTFYPEQNHINAQPNKIFEYMASGLPVIGSKFPFWEEIITKNNAGLCVDPMSPIAIGEAINYILNNPNEAKIMGENGRKMVIEKYNWDIEKKKLIDLYQELSK